MKLLERLTTTPGIPGRELRIRKLIERETRDLFDETHVDALGSLHGVRRPRPDKDQGKKSAKQPVKVMIAAHMDQIGFMVRFVDDKGFLWIAPVGGFDARNLFARVVTVVPDLDDPKQDLVGVLTPGGRPIHIARDEDKKKIPELTEFYVDLGLPADEVKRRVKVGDTVTINAPLYEVGETVVGQCLDNRVACWVAIEALKKTKHHDCEIHCVFTVQEEVGLRGAGTAAYAIRPDVGIGLDTTLCCDTPGITDNERITKQGEGVGLNIMDSSAIVDLELLETFERLAQQHQIKAQRTVMTRGGTDSGTMQRAGSGVRVMTLLTPTRYIHTVTEMVHKDDLHASRDLLSAYLAQA